MKNIKLMPWELYKNCEALHLRVSKRFSQHGLSKTSARLRDTAQESAGTAIWINKPNWYIRIAAWLSIILLVVSVIGSVSLLKITTKGINLAETFQMIDSAFNCIVLIGGAGFFLMAFESRRKRKRVLTAINRLRCIAHLIDAHQLSKDPPYMAEKTEPTMSEESLMYYLDYCSEMLSMTSKIAFVYVQDFDDSAANEAASDLEQLTTGLSQKIWQKIVMLRRRPGQGDPSKGP